VSLKDFFISLPGIDQVSRSQFYIQGYTEALGLFSEVRVVFSPDWLQEVSEELKSYFMKVGFPCYLVPIFREHNCYGFVVKGLAKLTPKFSTNELAPGCERLKRGQVVILVEGFKDCYVPMMAFRGDFVTVLPMLTSLPTKALLGMLNDLDCRVILVPDNDGHAGNHSARFSELCGKVQVRGSVFRTEGIKDFGDFFLPEFRQTALAEARRLRRFVCERL
jgi:hypothetical protein